MKILHLGHATVFLPPFIKKMGEEQFNKNQHAFFLDQSIATHSVIESKNVKLFNKGIMKNFLLLLNLTFTMNKSDKIFLHGLFCPKIILVVFFMPWVLNKTYWVIWGADLYAYKYQKGWKKKIKYLFISRIAKKVGHMVTYIKGDYENAVRWFGSKAEYHECFMYKSNIFKEYSLPESSDNVINILLGNSADPTNFHQEIFSKIQRVNDKNIKIYVPLSYGDELYAKEIIKVGREFFDKKISFITEIMPFELYLDFLAKIDVVLFNHPYQQGMGNTITLLGLGKKVYMRSDVTQWKLFKDLGISVYDIEQFDLTDIKNNQLELNKEIVKAYFSEKTYMNQLLKIFN